MSIDTYLYFVHVYLTIYIHIVVCSLNGTLHFYTPLVVYNLATHYSPFVLITPSFSLHNSCLG